MKKRELAAKYFPGTHPDSAVRHLIRWIDLCRPLSETLRRLGYHRSQKSLTAKQVEAIYDFLGEP